MSEFPQSFDRFQIIRMLGRGGMGTVYLAKDQRLGRQVALKVLNSEGLASDDQKARFLREARSAAAIRHQNVATIYEVDETEEGQPFLVMEYCEGETLAQRMRRRALDACEFLLIARQLAAGVAAAHDNGIVHRDIKAANIIIEPTGLVKVLDFGLARLLPRELSSTPEKPTFESTSGHFFGTLHYLSPEQARGRQADERSDLFAIGVVLYQIATGQLPFNAEAPLMVLEKIRDAEPEPFVPLDPSLPQTVTKVIGRLLQKNPENRYQNARELLADLEAIDTPTVRIASTQQSRGSLARTVARPRWIRMTVIAAALFLVAIAIFLVRQTDNSGLVAAPPAEQTPIRSLAVLPLNNIANNTADDFLSVGLADALVTKLQQIPSLQVRPTSAVMPYRTGKVDLKTASDKLQVDGILEGRFLAAGDLVRVNLQLTDARTGYNIWTDSIDGKRADLLKLIDDVSSRTVTGLNKSLGVEHVTRPASVPRSTSPKAYEEYLKARALTGSFVREDFDAHVAALKRAIELDPNFAAAYADLAIALSLGQVRSLTTEPPERAEWFARQAVRLDPNLPKAHLALGRVFVRYPDRFRESVREGLAALRLEATDTHALHTVVIYFISLGEMEKAQCIIDRMVRVDPLSNEAKTRGYYWINAVDADGAMRHAQHALASKETELAGHDIQALSHILRGDIAAAEREAARAAELFPNHYLGKSLKAMIAAAKGDRGVAEAFIRSFEADANRNHWAAIRIAHCYAKLGNRDKAIEWVQRASDLGHHSWYSLIRHPWLQPLQADPEFQQIVAKIKADLDDVRDDVIGVYTLICR